MKGNWKYLIRIVIALNIAYIGLYYYTNFLYKSNIQPNQNERIISLNNTTKLPTLKEQFPPLEYGDLIQDHKLVDVGGTNINISSANHKFKYIKITQPLIPDNIDIDNLTTFIELRNILNNSRIQFFYIVVGEFSSKQKEILSDIQKRFNIRITSISNSQLYEYFKLPDCRCGLNILLDSDNKVRLAHKGLKYETLQKIFNQELLKNSISNEEY